MYVLMLLKAPAMQKKFLVWGNDFLYLPLTLVVPTRPGPTFYSNGHRFYGCPDLLAWVITYTECNLFRVLCIVCVKLSNDPLSTKVGQPSALP